MRVWDQKTAPKDFEKKKTCSCSAVASDPTSSQHDSEVKNQPSLLEVYEEEQGSGLKGSCAYPSNAVQRETA